MPLIIQKQSYSRLPWRLMLVRGPGWQTLPDSGFRTKKEAKACLMQLAAIGDWDTYEHWAPTQYAAVHAVLDAAPMRTALRALVARGMA